LKQNNNQAKIVKKRYGNDYPLGAKRLNNLNKQNPMKNRMGEIVLLNLFEVFYLNHWKNIVNQKSE